jgi:hypothetical protein
MFSFSQNLRDLLQNPEIQSSYLIEIDDYCITTFYESISFLNKTFINDAKIVGIEMPTISTVVDSESYKLVFADNDYSLRNRYNSDLFGKVVSVYLVFHDPVTQIPLTEENSYIVIYRGKVSGFVNETNTEAIGSVMSTLMLSSPVGNLDAVNQLFTTKNSIKNFDGTDPSFDQIYEGSGSVELRWGKA